MSHGRDWRDSWLCTRRDNPGRWLWRLVRLFRCATSLDHDPSVVAKNAVVLFPERDRHRKVKALAHHVERNWSGQITAPTIAILVPALREAKLRAMCQ